MLRVVILNVVVPNVIMLRAILLHVVVPNVIMLRAILLNAIMPRVAMVRVVAPIVEVRTIGFLNHFSCFQISDLDGSSESEKIHQST
jgi:hypothetical protein